MLLEKDGATTTTEGHGTGREKRGEEEYEDEIKGESL